MAPVRTQRDPYLVGTQVVHCGQPPILVFCLLRDMFSYVSVGMSSVLLRRGRSRGSTYRVASLEGEGLLVPPILRVQSYLMTHLVPVRLVPPLSQRLASGDLLVGERLPSREASVPEGLAVHEVPPVPALSE